MTTKKRLGRERERYAVPNYALQQRIPINEISILFQLLEDNGSLAALEEMLELLHEQRAFRPGYRKYLFRLLNYCALMGLLLITGMGTSIGVVPQQNVYLMALLCAISIIDCCVFSFLLRPDRDIREKKLMDRWVARAVSAFAGHPAFSALRLTGIERQEMSRLVLQDSIDRAPEGLL